MAAQQCASCGADVHVGTAGCAECERRAARRDDGRGSPARTDDRTPVSSSSAWGQREPRTDLPDDRSSDDIAHGPRSPHRPPRAPWAIGAAVLVVVAVGGWLAFGELRDVPAATGSHPSAPSTATPTGSATVI